MPNETQLICPRCNVPLKEVRTSGGVFYGCDVCGGRAVTIELLRKRFTPESINPLWLHAMRGEGPVSLPCPSCRQPMIGVALSDKAEIGVDVCQHCHFIWFDAREVDTLVPRQPQPAPVAAELPQKAREMLAMAEVERLSKQAEGSDFDSPAPEESWKQIAGFLGMPVEFDEPQEQRKPWATWLLSGVIISVSLLAFLDLRDVVQRFGLIPAEATRLGGLTFVTSFFLHAGIIHLAGNIISCWRSAMPWKIFCDQCVIWCSLHWQHSSVIWRISLLILVRTHLASAPAAALPASLYFTH
jgi:Zn-finger nucleic acid-binding protein